ncbi:putative LTR transposable element, partial [Pseudoloma neurophilia]
RKIYGKTMSRKDVMGIKEFLEETWKEFPFKMIQTDNGREFNNGTLKKWCEKHNIEMRFSTPHYHQGNGRVERAIRTIRSALKRSKGPLPGKVKRVIKAYNIMRHRGIGMSPNEAVKPENREIVLENSEKYRKEFKERKIERFNEGDAVLIRNENKKNKMDDEFKVEGKIEKILDTDKYLVKDKLGKEFLRHGSQLRIFPGDVGRR